MRNWYRNNDHENLGGNDGEGDETPITTHSDPLVSASEISYSIESFNAMATPVTITMVASALVVVFINTEELIAAKEEAYNLYHVFEVGGEDQSAAQNLGYSLINTLVFVAFICTATFMIVLCHKYRCMKVLYCYMALVTAALLGYFTSIMFLAAIDIYRIRIDKLSFAFLMYNYAVVGTLSIFLPRGFPRWLPQGYLIAGSVCLAWQLSYFTSWTAWTLLVMLALYDLFAVLAPCGPLKALAETVATDGAMALPGMLYEARLPSGAERRPQRRTESRGPDGEHQPEGQSNEGYENNRSVVSHIENNTNGNFGSSSSDRGELSNPTRQATEVPLQSQTTTKTDAVTTVALGRNFTAQKSQKSRELSNSPCHMDRKESENEVVASTATATASPKPLQHIEQDIYQQILRHDDDGDSSPASLSPPIPTVSVDISNTGKAPLALARLYRQPVLDTEGVLRPEDQQRNVYYTKEEIGEIEWTPQQLITEITCIFPPRGGRIARAESREQKYDAGIAYIVYDRSGNVQRKFVVTPMGSVLEVRRREKSRDGDDDDTDNNNTIKLGLGDFIFYSLLVSKAAQESFAAFSTCLLVVLSGLAATLVILAIRGKALPALPISIFLGVITFLWTKTFLQPWADSFLLKSIYV